MPDAVMERFNSFGERIKTGGAGLSRKMSAGVTSMSGKMKEMFQVTTQADKLVESATDEGLDGPDWVQNMQICDMVNFQHLNGAEVVRALKKRLGIRSSRVQLLTLCLLESCVKNCERMFAEVASERVLDEMVKAIDNPQTSSAVREKALKMIESWGESTEQLRHVPVFEETYKSLKSRGIQFPGRDAESLAPIFTPPRAQPLQPVSTETGGSLQDSLSWERENDVTLEHSKEVLDVARNSMELLSTVLTSSPSQEALKDELTSTLVAQCRQSQLSVQRLIEKGGDNEPLLFEALNVNDGLQQALFKYEEMHSAPSLQSNHSSEPALIPVGVVDEEESSPRNSENSLVRKNSAKPSVLRALQDEDVATADFDKMSLGKAGGSSPKNSRGPGSKTNDDLIIL